MGGMTFVTNGTGKTLNEAYKKAVEEAREEHGHEEGYSGAINSTDSLYDLTKKYKESKMPLPGFIDRYINADTGTCFAVCTQEYKPSKRKTLTKVEHVVNKGTMKWLLKYVVGTFDGDLESFDTKGKAVEFARKYSEKHNCRTTIHMTKVLEKGSTLVAKVDYLYPKDEKMGKWVFFGVARY